MLPTVRPNGRTTLLPIVTYVAYTITNPIHAASMGSAIKRRNILPCVAVALAVGAQFLRCSGQLSPT